MTTTPAVETARNRASETAEAPTPSARSLVRIVLVVFGWTALLWSIVGIFVAPAIPGGWWTMGAGVLLATLPIVAFVRGLHDDSYPGTFMRIWVMRPFWYAQVTMLALAPAALVGGVAGLFWRSPIAGGRIAVLIALPVVAVGLLAGFWGSRRLVVRDITFECPDLPLAFDGLRIAQLSDLHVGPHTPGSHLRRIVRTVEAAKPDLIAITGDQVDDFDRDTPHFNAAFGGLRAPLGVHAIPGNHDVYAGWNDVEAGMRSAGLNVLVNDAVPLLRGGEEIWLAGTGDPAASHTSWGGGASHAAPDIPRTLARVPEGGFVIALAHNPILWPALAERGVQVTLSGHTHHGQLSIPFLNWCLASPFLEHAMGTYTRGASHLYINPGTNYWGLPFRLGAWPEVTIATLRRAAASSAAGPDRTA